MHVECPKGYSVLKVVCDVCGRRFVLSRADCNEPDIACPECGGTLDEIDE